MKFFSVGHGLGRLFRPAWASHVKDGRGKPTAHVRKQGSQSRRGLQHGAQAGHWVLRESGGAFHGPDRMCPVRSPVETTAEDGFRTLHV